MVFGVFGRNGYGERSTWHRLCGRCGDRRHRRRGGDAVDDAALRPRTAGAGDNYAPSAPNIAVVGAAGTGESNKRLSSRALGFVERAAAPLVGVRLGETANERGEAVPPSTAATTSVVTTDM